MYTPLPGFAHLKAFVPPDPITYSHTGSTGDIAAQKKASHLVRVALEGASGVRPVLSLPYRRFHQSVKIHLRAFAREHNYLENRAGSRISSIHVRENGEIFGTALINEHQHAFIGYIDGDQLRSFRIL